MDKLLKEFAEFVGREWARQWLKKLRSAEEQKTSGIPEQPNIGKTVEPPEQSDKSK
jgi:hypothetical protein